MNGIDECNMILPDLAIEDLVHTQRKKVRADSKVELFTLVSDEMQSF